MFGDFERQSIYTRYSTDCGTDIISAIRERVPVHFTFPLRVNCRNTEVISSGIELVCKLKPGYTKVLSTATVEDIDLGFYKNQQEQHKLIEKYLRKLSASYLSDEIVILSFRDNERSCAGQHAPQKSMFQLRELHGEKNNRQSIYYTTVHAFKGLDAPAIIITDIEEIEGSKAEALLYIGMSRARIKLVLLIHEKCREQYMKTIRDSFTA